MPQRDQESQPRPLPKHTPETMSRLAHHVTDQDARQVDDHEVHLLDYVRVLYKRRWLVATTFLIVVLSVTVFTFTVAPVYEATAKLLIEVEGPNVLTFQEVIDESQINASYYQTQYDILGSRSLARATLDRLELWDAPEFGGGERVEDGFSVRRALGGTLSFVTQLFRPASDEEFVASDELAQQSATIDAFLGGLHVTPVRNSRIVDVKFRSAQPAIAANIVNALSRAYIDRNLEFKFLSSQEASNWLADRLAEQRTQVEASEAALQHYREENDAIALDDRQNVVVQQLADLTGAVTLVTTERIYREAQYQQLVAIQNDFEALDTFPGILSDVFIQQQKVHLADLQRQEAELEENLGDRHPDMLKVRSALKVAESLLEGEVGKVVAAVRNEYEAALSQERRLTAELDSQKAEALTMNRKGIEYGVLEREAESNRQIYENLLQRAKETGVAGELRTSNVRIVDEAEVPTSPVSPRPRQNLLLALFGGGMLAGAVAFLFEYLDSRIKTPHEIKTHLRLPMLGMIPMISDADLGSGVPLVIKPVPSIFVEALRTIRTNLIFAAAEEGARVIAVTSTGPGEGKTLVSSNLGIGLAQTGLRVLLIDADLRRPRLHVAFDQKSEPGLSNVLVGEAKVSAAVRRTEVSGLWLLPSGRVPPNPAELLGSNRCREFLSSLNENFDWIILDTPPVLPVTDASIVAHVVTDILFVVGAEMVSRHAANEALDQLGHAKARLAGAVLNCVDLSGNPFYFSRYYRQEYAQYYQRS